MEELEEMTALVSGGGGLEDHLEAAADLHRAVALLWEGVGDALSSLPEEDRRPGGPDDRTRPELSGGEPPGGELQTAHGPQGVPLSEEPPGANETVVVVGTDGRDSAATAAAAAAREHAIVVSGMLKDQELLDIPMHLEGSALPTVTTALYVDAGRVQAAARFFVSGLLGALSAAARAAAEAASLQHQHGHRAGDQAGDATTPPAGPLPIPVALTPPAPAAPPPRAPPAPQAPPPPPPPDDGTGSPPGSGRHGISAPGTDALASDGGEEEERVETASCSSGDGGQADEEDQASTSMVRSPTSEASRLAEEAPPLDPDSATSAGQQGTEGEGEGITKAEVDEAWERARAMEVSQSEHVP